MFILVVYDNAVKLRHLFLTTKNFV